MLNISGKKSKPKAMGVNKRAKLIIAAIAAVGVFAGVLVAYLVHRAHQIELIESRYRADLDQLFQPRKENELNPAMSLQLLKDLGEQIDSKSHGDAVERKKLRDDVALKLSALFEGNSFDLGRDNNVRLELTAMKSWTEYKELLTKNTKANYSIIFRYYLGLASLHGRDPEFVEGAKLLDDGQTQSTVAPKDNNDAELLRDLNNGYTKHIELLKTSLAGSAEQLTKDALLQSFCWYISATNNQSLTESVYRYDKVIFAEEEERCAQKRLVKEKHK